MIKQQEIQVISSVVTAPTTISRRLIMKMTESIMEWPVWPERSL